MALPIDAADVAAARTAIAGQVIETPCLPAPGLSARTGAEIWVKFETFQRTSSFKERGALNRLLALDAAARKTGVIAMSAGNHAQAVACHAARLGLPAVIVMPADTPNVKVERTRAFGARVVLHGDGLDEAAAEADRLRAAEGLTFVHPYDDPAVMAGQGTLALEMLETAGPFDALVVPVGGGGLIAGMATAVRNSAPATEIVGVQSALYPAVCRRLAGSQAGEASAGGASLAEGIAVKAPGERTLAVIRALVDEVRTVPESRIEEAIDLFLRDQNTVAEGAGAAGLAAVLDDPGRFRGRKVGLVLSGGNIDPRLLSSILMRGLVREGMIVGLRIALPDRPGALAEVTAVIARAGGNILDVHHRRLFPDVSIKSAEVDVVLETRDRAHVEAILAALAAAGMPGSLNDEIADIL